jgi:hypothetical protein
VCVGFFCSLLFLSNSHKKKKNSPLFGFFGALFFVGEISPLFKGPLLFRRSERDKRARESVKKKKKIQHPREINRRGGFFSLSSRARLLPQNNRARAREVDIPLSLSLSHEDAFERFLFNRARVHAYKHTHNTPTAHHRFTREKDKRGERE